MKKVSLFTYFIVVVTFSSCGKSEMESDAKKHAEAVCRLIQTDNQPLTNTDPLKLQEEVEKLTKEKIKCLDECQKISGEMEKKYTSESDKKKYFELFEKYKKECAKQ